MPAQISFPETELSDLKLPQSVSVETGTGSANIQVDIPVTSGRAGVQPVLSLVYGSAGGNSPYGKGWGLSGIPSVRISLKNGSPRYDGHDKFSFQGQELVPHLEEVGGVRRQRQDETSQYRISYFRSQYESDFTRVERWVDKTSRQAHWRAHNRNNQVFVFGLASSGISRIASPSNPENVFQWLLEAFYDNRGNAIEYDYVSEDAANVEASSTFEHKRLLDATGFAQRYIKRIRYGNTIPILADQAADSAQQWLFELLFDYGEYPSTGIPSSIASASGWPARIDPFSNYIPGFEIRSYRLCRRVLMFHHFGELGDGPTIVGELKLHHRENEAGTLLRSIDYTGYRRDPVSGEYEQKSLPPLKYIYSNPQLERAFRPIPTDSAENLPIGFGGLNYRWFDLKGEGLPGVLFETSQGWYYKSNKGNGRLGKQELVASRPMSATGTLGLSDFNSDGNPGIVTLQGREAGYYEYDRDSGQWQAFRAFSHSPSVRPLDTYTQLIDITGDGLADIVTIEQDRIVCYPSKGKDGFDQPFAVSKPQSNGSSHTPAIGANNQLDYFFIDMTGDGRADQVRITNGRVEYWPNLGMGRFAEGIVMQDSPWLEEGFEFDASRIRLVDLDGSGTADLVYLGRGEIRYWINAAGNRFVEGGVIRGLPYIDNLAAAQIIDFLGNGTACLVWSKGASNGHSDSLQYLQLTSGIKPGLIHNVDNSMGQEIQLEYSTSAEHFLRDEDRDEAWLSKLPSHVTVVNRQTTIDHIGNTRFVQRFEYHDGFYDSQERQFRGFGLVDQYDSDVYQGTSEFAETEFTAPLCVRTWFHNGDPGWEFKRSQRFYRGDSVAANIPSFGFENLQDLQHDEYNDAVRSIAGRAIRTEVYAVETEGERYAHPYKVTQNGYNIRHIQGSTDMHDAVFAIFLRETVDAIYEQAADDPRINHSLTTAVDEYGNPLATVSVAYPRRGPETEPEQNVTQIVLQHADLVNLVSTERYELGIPIEQLGFEVKGAPAPDRLEVYGYEEMALIVNDSLANQRPFDSVPSGRIEAKLSQWQQNYYWDDDRSAALPLRSIGQTTLQHHTDNACFNNDFVTSALGSHHDPTLLSSGSYYSFRDDYWWQSSAEVEHHGSDRFYLSRREITPSGEWSEYIYDSYNLVIKTINDSLSNTITSEIDYHFVVPQQITDINENVSQVRYDALGMIVLSTVQGTLRSESGSDEMYGHDLLTSYTPPTGETIENILRSPERFVQGVASYLYYELDSWDRELSLRIPLRSVDLLHEDWVYDGTGSRSPSPSIAVGINYRDGFGRDLQNKKRVDDGEALQIDSRGELETVSTGSRWLTSGHVAVNSKQQAVRQFEPYYSVTHEYQSEEQLERLGNSVLIQYDAIGRKVQQDFADGTRSYVRVTPWSTAQYDPNDSVIGSRYETDINSLTESSNPLKEALRKARAHNNTPVVNHFDPRGETFLVEEQNERGEMRRIRTELDNRGNPLAIVDPRNLTAFRYRFDMRNRLFYEFSMDAGEKWYFVNGLNQATHNWDANGNQLRTEFDRAGRVTALRTHGGGEDLVVERYSYGDSGVTDAQFFNLRGKLVEHFDQAGYQRYEKYELTGIPLQRQRRLIRDYRNKINWPDVPRVADYEWLPGTFTTKVKLDALGRPREERLPDLSTRHYTYGKDGTLKRIGVSTDDGLWRDKDILSETAHNALGQVTSRLLGNRVRTNYVYSPTNYRLQQLHSFNDDSGPRVLWQDIRYTYDPVGNLIQNIDLAQQARSDVIRNLGAQGSARNNFTYDAFYQLITAEGRVHQGLLENDHNPAAANTVKGTRRISFNDGTQVERYTRNYRHDISGNLLNIRHHSASRNWNRQIWTAARSNRSLPLNDLNGIEITDKESRFDNNGNCEYLPHLRSFVWNYKNQLANAVFIDRSAESRSDDAEYYVYDSDGMRVRKVHEQLVGADGLRVTEKIYIDGCEIKRITNRGRLELERKTLHITTGSQRIALVHQWSVDTQHAETDELDRKKIHYQLGDQLESASLELDDDAIPISYEEFYPFGETSFIAGDLQEVKRKDYRYTGKERDDKTGLYYFGYRYYAPWIGNWLSPDPIGPEDGLNLYQYAQNNPVVITDPNGLQSTGFGSWLPFNIDLDEVENTAIRGVRGLAGLARQGVANATNSLRSITPEEVHSEIDAIDQHATSAIDHGSNAIERGIEGAADATRAVQRGDVAEAQEIASQTGREAYPEARRSYEETAQAVERTIHVVAGTEAIRSERSEQAGTADDSTSSPEVVEDLETQEEAIARGVFIMRIPTIDGVSERELPLHDDPETRRAQIRTWTGWERAATEDYARRHGFGRAFFDTLTLGRVSHLIENYEAASEQIEDDDYVGLVSTIRNTVEGFTPWGIGNETADSAFQAVGSPGEAFDAIMQRYSDFYYWVTPDIPLFGRTPSGSIDVRRLSERDPLSQTAEERFEANTRRGANQGEVTGELAASAVLGVAEYSVVTRDPFRGLNPTRGLDESSTALSDANASNSSSGSRLRRDAQGRLRDERGRFARDPDAPASAQQSTTSTQPSADEYVPGRDDVPVGLGDNPRNLPPRDPVTGEREFDVWPGGLIRRRIRTGVNSDGITSGIRSDFQGSASRWGTIDGPPIPNATGADVHVGHIEGHAHVLSPEGTVVEVAPQTRSGNLRRSPLERAEANRRRRRNAAHPDRPQLPVRPSGQRRN